MLPNMLLGMLLNTVLLNMPLNILPNMLHMAGGDAKSSKSLRRSLITPIISRTLSIILKPTSDRVSSMLKNSGGGNMGWMSVTLLMILISTIDSGGGLAEHLAVSIASFRTHSTCVYVGNDKC